MQLTAGESWQTDVLDQQPPTGALNDYTDPKKPTAEERAMLEHGRRAGVVGLYYVPAMSSGSRGEAFSPLRHSGPARRRRDRQHSAQRDSL